MLQLLNSFWFFLGFGFTFAFGGIPFLGVGKNIQEFFIVIL